MLPGKGSVVANASGTGVHESEGYCGHGGGGGLIARAERCDAISFERVDMRIGLADAAPANRSEPTRARASAHLCIRLERLKRPPTFTRCRLACAACRARSASTTR